MMMINSIYKYYFPLTIFALIFILNNFVYSNNDKNKLLGEISGKIVNSDSLFPLIGASIALYNSLDSSLVKGDYSDKNGKFEFEKIPFGKYYIKISYIGYRSKIINSVNIDENDKKLKVGKIKLVSQDVNTEQIEISGSREFIQIDPDKQVIYVNKNLTSYGETAIDFLKNVPIVTVDIDDNVKLRGTEFIKFLINGKESNIDESDILSSIPLSNINRFEIITNPSSKYDAESNSGIINIILNEVEPNKKAAKISLNLGTSDKYSASAYWSSSFDKFSYFLNYDFNSKNTYALSNQTKSWYSPIDTSKTIRNQNDFEKKMVNGTRLGFEYKFNHSNTISFNAHYINNSKDMIKFRKYSDYLSNNFDDYHEKGILNDNTSNNIDLSLDYKIKFNNNGHQLLSFITYSTGIKESIYNYNHIYYYVKNNEIIKDNKLDFLEKANSTNNGSLISVNADYTLPIQKFSKIEIGYKSVIRYNNTDYLYQYLTNNSWENDTLRSNDFDYNEHTNALYLVFSSSFKSLNYSLGLRAELTEINTKQFTTNKTNKSDYFYMFPSIQLKYDISNFNNLRLSLSRRINRPKMKSLNPFIDFSDPQELTAGNPELLPELTNQAEIGYFHLFENTTLLTNLFYKNSSNSIAKLALLYDSSTVILIPKNYTENSSYGVEFIISQDIVKWLKADANLSIYNSNIMGSYNNQNLSFNKNSLNSKLSLYYYYGKLFNIQFSLIYQTPEYSLQTSTNEFFTADLGLKYNIIKNKLFINAKVNDIFKTMEKSYYLEGPNFTIDKVRIKDNRYFSLGITYQFNEISNENEKRLNAEDEEEFKNSSIDDE